MRLGKNGYEDHGPTGILDSLNDWMYGFIPFFFEVLRPPPSRYPQGWGFAIASLFTFCLIGGGRGKVDLFSRKQQIHGGFELSVHTRGIMNNVARSERVQYHPDILLSNRLRDANDFSPSTQPHRKPLHCASLSRAANWCFHHRNRLQVIENLNRVARRSASRIRRRHSDDSPPPSR